MTRMRITVTTVHETELDLSVYPDDVTTPEQAVEAEKKYIAEGDEEDYLFLVTDGEWKDVKVELVE